MSPTPAKIIQHPSADPGPKPRNSSPRRATSAPDTMRPAFDLVAELTLNRDRYSGPEWLSIHALPGSIETCIDRVITACALHDPTCPKPGVSPVIAACCYSGVNLIRESPDVIATFDLRTRLTAIQIDPDESDELADFLRRFRLSTPSASTSGARRVNVTFPNYIKAQVNELSDSLGVTASSLIVMCVAMVLCDQPAVLDKRREELCEAVKAFYRRVRMRRRVAEKWLAEILER